MDGLCCLDLSLILWVCPRTNGAFFYHRSAHCDLQARFEMPEIPSDWRPRPARVWGMKSRWDQAIPEVPEEKEVVRGAPGRPLTSEQVGVAHALYKLSLSLMILARCGFGRAGTGIQSEIRL
jgi:hypothetical protein